MKYTDLRIGSTVNYKGKIHNIDASDFDQLEYDIEDGIITAVPITEELLIERGFETQEDVNRCDYELDNSLVVIGINKDTTDTGVEFDCFLFRQPLGTIKYVHQLENLYLLTGEELKVK